MKYNIKNKKNIIGLICILIFIILIVVLFFIINKEDMAYVSYKEFYNELENGNIWTVEIQDQRICFVKAGNKKVFYTDNPKNDEFKEKLLLSGVSVTENSTMETVELIFNIFFYLFFFGTVIFAGYKFISISEKDFKVVKNTNVKFSDIAGMDELKKDMTKIVEILKNPNQYNELGIRQVKGIIFEGNPGNGKTLFAKALASEMNVKFIATRGADFQSAIMSMGARKIKVLFKKAKKYKPCIIFIDEFDSIGESRNYTGTGVDKENNRIVTAMLNEMDGFNSQDGILVIAATNSYNSLDNALIRPGRFDLRYTIPNPDLKTRLELIDLYTKKKSLSDDINKQKLAESFENLSCSAIETILNESAVEALLNNNEKITIENIIIACKKTNSKINLKKIL